MSVALPSIPFLRARAYGIELSGIRLVFKRESSSFLNSTISVVSSFDVSRIRYKKGSALVNVSDARRAFNLREAGLILCESSDFMSGFDDAAPFSYVGSFEVSIQLLPSKNVLFLDDPAEKEGFVTDGNCPIECLAKFIGLFDSVYKYGVIIDPIFT
ncbi:hypothetical protein U1Q18_050340, partial [Sarracenia purpurea var. burkii]